MSRLGRVFERQTGFAMGPLRFHSARVCPPVDRKPPFLAWQIAYEDNGWMDKLPRGLVRELWKVGGFIGALSPPGLYQ